MKGPKPRPVVERFWAKVHITTTCWLWVASIDKGGYGQFYDGTRLVQAHRYAYELMVGPITGGLEIDHQCHNKDTNCRAGNNCLHRRCVNPEHLEPALHKINSQRGRAAQIRREQGGQLTRCPQGHPYDDNNTISYYRIGHGNGLMRT